MDYQFYPTPKWLATKARSKFTTPVTKLLEPSAGKADLLMGDRGLAYCRTRIDVIEIDPTNQATLKGHGLTVVGHDFMDFRGGAMYSHILLNPPFNQGVDHVLHAWKIMFDGEIVAIINAETLRNPCSEKRKYLANLIELYGSVEYLDSAFNTGEEERSAEVDIALVYLKKTAETINFTEGLKVDEIEIPSINNKELAIKGSTIPAVVATFNLAVEAHRAATIANAKAAKMASHLELSIAFPAKQEQEQEQQEQGTDFFHHLTCVSFSAVRGMIFENFNKGYQVLKERAWSTILKSSNITSRLTSKAQQSLESEFESIKQLEFTVRNIYGFLEGVMASQQSMNNAMMCEVFDLISMYHSKNRSYYRGWKSNDKHRVFGFKIQGTRFVLPLSHAPYFNLSSISHYDQRWIEDIDKVFCYLDSKDYVRSKDDVKGVSWAFSNHLKELVSGSRIKTDYFDIRYYPGANTVHFFPTRKDLIDRLNWVVGNQRAWIPETVDMASSEFWDQYEQAEKITKGINGKTKNERRLSYLIEKERQGFIDDDSYDKREYDRVISAMDEGHREMLEKLGIDELKISATPSNNQGVKHDYLLTRIN